MALTYQNGRPKYYRYEGKRRIYVASGTKALVAAERDARRRSELLTTRQRIDQEHSQITDSQAALGTFVDAVEALNAAVLIQAGYHRQCRGPWRKKRQ